MIYLLNKAKNLVRKYEANRVNDDELDLLLNVAAFLGGDLEEIKRTKIFVELLAEELDNRVVEL